MTTQRKDEMPETVYLCRDSRGKPMLLQDGFVSMDMCAYHRTEISPPVPDDVADIWREMPDINVFVNKDPTAALGVWAFRHYQTLQSVIRAASTPDAGLVEALKTISKDTDLNEWTNEFEPSRAAKIARKALAKLEEK